MFFSTTTSVSSLLHVLAAAAASASIPFVAAQTTTETEITAIIDELNGKISTTAPPPGFNVEGTSVFSNFARAFKEGQFFVLYTGNLSGLGEKPGTVPVSVTMFDWCSDLTFSDISNSSTVGGYAGRCVSMFLAGYADMLAVGGNVVYVYSEERFGRTVGISAVFVEKQNLFEGQYHSNTDDLVFRYWDDGRKTMPAIGWEGHDEGDMAPNAPTSSWSSFGEFTWMSIEEVAQMFNTSVDEYTPDKFKQIYENTWLKNHEDEAAIENPNAEAELEIVDEVKNETDSTGETTAPAAPGTAEDGGTGPIDDSASGRKLASVAARFVSAALRVFGI
jgi:hypothetical protein